MPRTAPVVSRRRVLAGGAALAMLGITASACGSRPEPPPAVDQLEAQLTLARHDSEVAAAAATAESPQIAGALKEVASERSQHAHALTAEIDRVAGITTSISSTSSSTTTTTLTSAPPGPAPTLSDVVDSLRASAASAAQLATTLSGFRAGLLGSIAAACTAAYTVGLVFGEAAALMTSAEPSPESTSTSSVSPSSHEAADGDALCAALATEYAVIYGYGIVSARCAPDVNGLVTSAMSQHRERRDQVIATLAARKVTAPVAAAGYQLPMPVSNATDAARLAAQMEKDTEVAWRAVVEQAQAPQDREFGGAALTQSAVLAARWNRVVGTWPITTAFPGGSD